MKNLLNSLKKNYETIQEICNKKVIDEKKIYKGKRKYEENW